MSEFPSRASMKDALRDLDLISGQSTHDQAVLDEISERMTQEMSEANAMRTELYLGDVISVVREGIGEEDTELLKRIKQGDAFNNLSTAFTVSDLTTLALLKEVREKLSSQRE